MHGPSKCWGHQGHHPLDSHFLGTILPGCVPREPPSSSQAGALAQPGTAHCAQGCQYPCTSAWRMALLMASVARAAWTHQVLVIEQVHHTRCPVTHRDKVRGCPVQAQQAQGCALLHAVHGVSGRQSSAVTTQYSPEPCRTPQGLQEAEGDTDTTPTTHAVPSEGSTHALQYLSKSPAGQSLLPAAALSLPQHRAQAWADLTQSCSSP